MDDKVVGDNVPPVLPLNMLLSGATPEAIELLLRKEMAPDYGLKTLLFNNVDARRERPEHKPPAPNDQGAQNGPDLFE